MIRFYRGLTLAICIGLYATFPALAGENRDTITSLLAAENSQNAEAIGALMAEGIVFSYNGIATDGGRAAGIAGFESVFQGFPDFHREAEEIIESDSTIVLRWVLTGTLENDWEGIVASGQRLRLPGCTVFHLQEGLITEWHEYYDNESFYEQLDVGFEDE